MSRWFRPFTRRGALGLVVLAATAIGLQGCFRGGYWHGRHDPAAFDARLNDMQEELADHLKITPAQKPQFDALMAEYRQTARDWRDGWRQTGLQVQAALERDPADADAVAAALKQQVHQRMDEAALNKLIDDTVAFYRTLNPDQQQEIRERLLKRLKRRLG